MSSDVLSIKARSCPSAAAPRWICAQIGAREHYAIPRALRLAGRDALLCTDFWAGPVTRNLFVGKLRSLAARCHPDLQNKPAALVKSWNWRTLHWEMLRHQQARARTPYHGFIEAGRRFACCVREELKRAANLKDGSVFFAYDTGALEAMEWCRPQGIKCVLNQMDPNRVEVELVCAEEKNWPGWALQPLKVPEEYFARREREWALADCVVVNSDFSRRALLQQGVPAEKLFILPLCYEADQRSRVPAPKDRGLNQPLRVLFLGQVILRKGIQYLLAAARELEGENIHFDIVGPVGISNEAIKMAPANVTFHGRAERDQAAAWYQRSRLFVLPTLSDGFAMTQIEAMSHGLPVIATPNCGEVVADGVDGFIIPPRDPGKLVEIFRRYLVQPELLPIQSAAALKKSREFSLNRLAENLVRLEAELLEGF